MLLLFSCGKWYRKYCDGCFVSADVKGQFLIRALPFGLVGVW